MIQRHGIVLLVNIALGLLTLGQAVLTGRTQYHEGDFVSTARKAQFQQVRSEWHDLLGRHCPRFGVDQVVALPLLKPLTWEKTDEYKIMLSFDTERVLTNWITLIGARAPTPPLLTLTLTSVGSELRSVHAHVSAPTAAYLAVHPALALEYKDPERWPKHLLIHYRWEQFNEVNAPAGLFVILSSAVATFSIVIVLGIAKYGNRIEPAMNELIASVEGASGDGERKGAPGDPAGYPRAPAHSYRPPPKRGSHHD